MSCLSNCNHRSSCFFNLTYYNSYDILALILNTYGGFIMVKIPDKIKNLNIDNLDFTNKVYIKQLFISLLNLIELLCSELRKERKEKQKYKDEVNRLKGEQGKPDIKPNTHRNKKPKEDNKENKDKPKDKEDTDDKKPKSKDKDRTKIYKTPKKEWNKTTKKDKIHIDRVEVIDIDKSILPEDAVFKGYVNQPKQEIKIVNDNVLYKLEKYHSPSENKTYIAELPPEYQGTEFGPNIKALTHYLYFEAMVTENKIHDFFTDNGIIISSGTVSNILTKDHADILTQEKKDIFQSGLHSANYQQIDDTGFRQNGDNCYLTIVCNDNYSAYFVNERKNRETIEKILYNKDTKAADFNILICDDAKQFHKVTDVRGLCWVHEERHFKKLTPIVKSNIEILRFKRGEIWDYYDELLEYKENPTKDKKEELNKKFDEIFSEVTGFIELDQRLKLSLEKKEFLLAVLDYPEIPLHNNLSENGIRIGVKKRKISGGTRSLEGTTAWENNMTILSTCKKLGVKYYQYLKDLFSKKMKLPRLADLIKKEKNKANKESL